MPARIAALTKLRRASVLDRHPSIASLHVATALRQRRPRAHSGQSRSRHSSASKAVATLRAPLPGKRRVTGSPKSMSAITSSICYDRLLRASNRPTVLVAPHLGTPAAWFKVAGGWYLLSAGPLHLTGASTGFSVESAFTSHGLVFYSQFHTTYCIR